MNSLCGKPNELVLLKSFSGFDEPVRFSGIGPHRHVIVHPNGQHLILSAAAFYFLKAIRDGYTVGDLYKMQLQSGTRHDEMSLERACRKALNDFNKVAHYRVVDLLPWGFWMQFRLMPESLIASIGERCKPMFAPPLIVISAALCVFGIIETHHFLQVSRASHLDVATLYFLFLISLVCHEFGHASACSLFGCRAKEIGFTVYLIYPALYCDVTAAWGLSKWRRVVVDVSGCYFQATLGGLLSILWMTTNKQIFGMASAAIFYSVCLSLCPLFRADGYWMLADILGVKRLNRSIVPAFRELLSLSRSDRSSTDEPIGACIIIAIYSLLTSLVWIKFSLHVIPFLLLSSHAVMHQLPPIELSLRTMHLLPFSTYIAFISSACILLLACFGAIRLALAVIYKANPLVKGIAGNIRKNKMSDSTIPEVAHVQRKR